MNANSFCIVILAFTCYVYGVLSQQQLNDGNYLSEAEIDYQDYQLLPKSALKPFQTLLRTAKPRSPVINSASQQTKVTPVPILKQINRHNEDGSYTYGFEGADGSFKIETKLASGEVIGKYGYVDDSGKVRVVDYGANKYGFQPAGEGITIPPITISNETESDKSSDEEPEYVSTPAIRTFQKPPSFKRKPTKVPFYIPEQRFKPQTYFVQEQDDNPLLPNKAPLKSITPTDINSLQALFANDFRDPSQFRPELPYPPSSSPSSPSRKIAQQPLKLEENARDDIPLRPFPAGFPITNIFDNAPVPAPQFQIPQNEFVQQQFEEKHNGFKISPKFQSKPKPQVLFVTSFDDGSPTRRNSNPKQDRSILDELLKQYAIPNGSPAINDFSFSYSN